MSFSPSRPTIGRAVSSSLAFLAILGLASTSRGAFIPPAAVSSAAVGQNYGTIKGRLVFAGDTVPTPKVLVAKGDANAKDAAVCAADSIMAKDLVVDPKTKGVRYGFAYLVKPSGKNPELEAKLIANKPEVEIDQKNCEYTPYAVAIHKDQTLVFKSSDPVAHNIHYFAFTNGDLNQMLAPNSSMPKKFAAAERRPCKLVCDIHPWMTGFFMVFDHPFFTVTGADGSFEITGVPAGTQNLIVWQESVGYATPGATKGISVEVKAGETTDVGDVKLVPKAK